MKGWKRRLPKRKRPSYILPRYGLIILTEGLGSLLLGSVDLCRESELGVCHELSSLSWNNTRGWWGNLKVWNIHNPFIYFHSWYYNCQFNDLFSSIKCTRQRFTIWSSKTATLYYLNWCYKTVQSLTAMIQTQKTKLYQGSGNSD